ncbi:MAG: hypothetical protein IPJ89_05045 [Candidatus Iainarchaeum archaeon]|uniref:DUF333 domain-containing protein n=1 Tax=Candidatus Iainarchaeum sp. TaxID=3101447 RepID=A0A7T9DJH6_9ARCH|nr:MAG: hypothetical protein IPJ89_05045 [Candidatus Diapherotrites archaeon]
MATTPTTERTKHNAGARTLLLLLALVTVAGAIVAVSFIQTARVTNTNPYAHITNYDECVAAGYPALKSYPGQCILPDGTRFVQVIPEDKQINSYSACVAVGYPIMESAPPKCRTRDGRTFTATPDEWPTPSRFVAETSCTIDAECKLINEELGFACCHMGACQITDYSEDHWIAVNANWFDSQRAVQCPGDDSCGPAPLCAVQVEPSGYAPRCVQNTCQKVLEGTA